MIRQDFMPDFSRFIAVLIFALLTSPFAEAACTGEPAEEAVEKAKKYYAANSTLIEHTSRTKGEAPGKKIVINDYSKVPTTMYILNSETGECEDSSIVGFGEGLDKKGNLAGSCLEGSHLSPSGFHITTAVNPETKYPYPVGLTMLPCEGQEDTGARGIMIHPGTPNGKTGNTWGCPSLPDDKVKDFVTNKIKGGSLVYNYWKDDSSLPGCQNVGKSETCRLPASAGGGANGGSNGGGNGGDGQTRGTAK